MRKASWLAGSSVNGDTDVNDILDLAEEIVEVLIRHLEGHVADEEGFRRRVPGSEARSVAGPFFLEGVLDEHAAALEDLLVEGLHGFGGGT